MMQYSGKRATAIIISVAGIVLILVAALAWLMEQFNDHHFLIGAVTAAIAVLVFILRGFSVRARYAVKR